MKKVLSIYAICWLICLAVFNVVCFVTPGGESKYTNLFWIGYIFITLTFVAQLGTAFYALNGENINKTFYRISTIKISYIGLILMLIFGAVCMGVPFIPSWIGIIICVVILAINLMTILKAVAAGEIVEEIDEKVKKSTQFIKLQTIDAEGFVAKAKTEEIKSEVQKVYEAFRYSDPMSNENLSLIEAQITVKMAELGSSISEENLEKVKENSKEVLNLIGDRNRKCKALK